MIELKPCPKCGAVPRMVRMKTTATLPAGFKVTCLQCLKTSRLMPDAVSAADSWNAETSLTNEAVYRREVWHRRTYAERTVQRCMARSSWKRTVLPFLLRCIEEEVNTRTELFRQQDEKGFPCDENGVRRAADYVLGMYTLVEAAARFDEGATAECDIRSVKHFTFCPHCGAKMKMEDGSDD